MQPSECFTRLVFCMRIGRRWYRDAALNLIAGIGESEEMPVKSQLAHCQNIVFPLIPCLSGSNNSMLCLYVFRVIEFHMIL